MGTGLPDRCVPLLLLLLLFVRVPRESVGALGDCEGDEEEIGAARGEELCA